MSCLCSNAATGHLTPGLLPTGSLKMLKLRKNLCGYTGSSYIHPYVKIVNFCLHSQMLHVFVVWERGFRTFFFFQIFFINNQFVWPSSKFKYFNLNVCVNVFHYLQIKHRGRRNVHILIHLHHSSFFRDSPRLKQFI